MSGAEAFGREIAQIIIDEIKKGIPAKDLYTLEEAATFLACSVEQMRRFMNTNRLPTVKIDSRPRFRRRDLEKFIEAAKT